MCEGYNHVVDLDLSKFFDTVDHDILMGLGDKDIRRLLFVFLKAGVMNGGKLEKRGLRFVRYAEDCQLFTKSDYAAARVMKNATKYLEEKLKL